MSTNVGIFDFKGNRYCLEIFINEDDRVEMQDVEGNVLVTFTSNGEINLDNKPVGRIQHANAGYVKVLEYFFYNDPAFKIGTGVPISDVDCYFKAEKLISLFLLQLAEMKAVTVTELANHFK